MFNPSYLMLSRHRIYYFRWPLPRPEGQNAPRYIRLSLRTREPHEALRLARTLEYHASSFTTQAGPELMKHSEAKAIVEQYCRKVLDERKRQISDKGGLTQEQEALHQKLVDDAAMYSGLAEGGVEVNRLVQTACVFLLANKLLGLH